MDEKQETGISDRHVEFCKKIVELAKEHGAATFAAEFRPDDTHYGDTIKFSWHRGRHHAPARVHIESVVHAYSDV